jgi:3'(2'), 5'-bisphosphate nucleotidase
VTESLTPLARTLAEVAHEAGRLILTYYARGTDVRIKDDASPVTEADEAAEALITERLRAHFPDIPIVAEEAAASGKTFETGKRFFLVDPLDGTKEFLKRNGEFTVNIALIENGLPVAGVVLAPAKARCFIGDGKRAYEAAAPEDLPLEFSAMQEIRARKTPHDGVIAVVSRTHRDQKTEEYLAAYTIVNMVAAGSSLKFCLVATGEADLYPRHGRTMEWDTAAGHAVLLAAGGSVAKLDGSPLLYGKKGFENPHFIARGLV